MTETFCARCQREKPANEFAVRADSGRLDSYCRLCRRILRRESAMRHRDRESQRKQRWAKAVAPPCADCGAAISKPYVTLCVDCARARKHEDAFERTKRWLAMRRQGMGNIAIAEAEGVSPAVVATSLQRSHVARFEWLVWLPAPYAAARGIVA